MEEHSIGKKIAELRIGQGLTQIELAEKLNISDKTISKWESEAGIPDISQFPILSKIFGVSIDFLMTGIPSKEDNIVIEKCRVKSNNDTKMQGLKSKFSKNIFVKYYDYIFALFIDKNYKFKELHLFDGTSRIETELLKLNDFLFLEELCKNNLFCNKQLEEVFHYDEILKLIKEKTITDDKFIDYIIKKDPVKTLKLFYLTDEKITDKKGILKCLKNGGYIEKISGLSQFNSLEYEKDVLATILLKEYCEK